MKKDYNTTITPGKGLLITWVKMTYQIERQYLLSITCGDSGQ